MKLIEKIRENNQWNKFKKNYEKLVNKKKFEECIELCKSKLDNFNSIYYIDYLYTNMCYSFMCMDDVKSFIDTKDKIVSKQQMLLPKYYELLIILDQSRNTFNDRYADFTDINNRKDIGIGLTAYFVLKKEIDEIKLAIDGQKKLNKSTVNHIKKSNLPVLKRLLERVI
jgi:hypothetical protein